MPLKQSVPTRVTTIFGTDEPTPEQQALDAKREYNIALREQRYDAKQKEVAAVRRQKKQLEEENRQKLKNAELKRRQENLAQGLAKKQNNMEDDYREKNREAAISRREAKWQAKMNSYISLLIESHQEQFDNEAEARSNAKNKKAHEAKTQAKERALKKTQNEQLEEIRSDVLQKREAERLSKEMIHCDELTQEIEQEIEYKYECWQQGIPTKVTMNDMVKSLVPVPTISELFCAVKSELDEIKYLKGADLESLANLAGKPVLTYVKELNKTHESNRLPVPNAVVAQQ